MTKHELLLERINYSLEEFIYDEELEVGEAACLWMTESNRCACPYGEEHMKENCLQCIKEYLACE